LKEFKTPYIIVDKDGIDLIRNYSVYKHIDYKEISKYDLEKGFIHSKWFILLTVALVICALGGIYLIKILVNWNAMVDSNAMADRTVLSLLISPFLVFFGGIVLFVVSVRKSMVLYIETASKKYRISLPEIVKKGELNDLIDFLKKHIKKR